MDVKKFIIYLLALILVSFLILLIIARCDYREEHPKTISVKSTEGTVYDSYQAACSKCDFDAARDYVAKMKQELIRLQNNYSSSREEYAKSVEEAEKYVENEELLFLTSLNEEQANNRIVTILTQRPIEGIEPAEMECLDKEVTEWSVDLSNEKGSERIKSFKKYISWCGVFNTKCNTLLSTAIASDNQSLAEKIIRCYRPDPEILLKNKRKKEGDIYFDAYAHFTNTSKEAAQKKYDEAVKSGAFN